MADLIKNHHMLSTSRVRSGLSILAHPRPADTHQLANFPAAQARAPAQIRRKFSWDKLTQPQRGF
ncbi:protein of unknown function [Pseudomonas sp. JV241A]|nr:protein of unknown function [Pseudomonas sp. JV241A]